MSLDENKQNMTNSELTDDEMRTEKNKSKEIGDEVLNNVVGGLSMGQVTGSQRPAYGTDEYVEFMNKMNEVKIKD